MSDDRHTYRAVLKRPGTVERRQSRCLKLVERLQTQEKLQNQATNSDRIFWILATNESCQTSGTEVTMTVRLSLEALKYVSSYHRYFLVIVK